MLTRLAQARRALTGAAWVLVSALELALAAALAASVGLIWWLGTDGSLATALRLAPRWLPAGHVLQTSDVHGSVLAGGRIGSITWADGSLRVSASELRVRWRLRPLMDRELVLEEASADALTVQPLGTSADPTTTPPADLRLPLRVRTPLQVRELRWQGATPLLATDVAGHYSHDGQSHSMSLDNIRIAQGRYTAQLRLGATAPLPLDARIDGTVRAVLPARQGPLSVHASAGITGSIGRADSSLTLTATVQPAAGTGETMRAQVDAVLLPWATQPVRQAQVRLHALDLAALWPGAPRTRLRGDAQLLPTPGMPDQWQGQAQLRNDAPGPWDKGQLPLEQLQGQLGHAAGQWTLTGGVASLGAARVTAEGSYRAVQSPGPAWLRARVDATARIHRLEPAALHSQLRLPVINGQLHVRHDGALLRFDTRMDAQLNPALNAQAHSPPLIQRVHARGHWQAQRLRLDALDLSALGLHLQAENLGVDLQHKTLDGHLRAQAPGAQATMQGTLGVVDTPTTARTPAIPAGQFALRLSDPVLADAWLRGARTTARAALAPFTPLRERIDAYWPDMPALPAAARGQASAQGRWTGAWPVIRLELAQLQARWTGAAALNLPGPWALDLATPWVVRIDPVAGQTRPGLDAGAARLTLAGPAAPAELAALPGGATPTPASASASAPASTGPPARSPALPPLSIELGGLQLVPASAPVTTPTRTSSPATAGWRWRTQGALRGLSMAWTDALGGQAVRERLGISGDLGLHAEWDIGADPGRGLQGQAALRRAGGDLRVLAGDTGVPTAAGLRDAAITLDLAGTQASARLLWDSERAGQAQLEASTQLTHEAGHWHWPERAPVSARLNARMPDLGVWTLLAPPGWRVRGTLDARAMLAGTRDAPRWSGTLAADQLALRSAVDGIDLRDGLLRATLRDERIDIDRFELRAGRGSGARILGPAGNRTAPASDGGLLTATGTVGIDRTLLQASGTAARTPVAQALVADIEARAQRLQVQVRADRQLSVSGLLNIGLRQGQFSVQGRLGADRATIILPEDTAPRLGDDVVITRAHGQARTGTATPGAATPGPRPTPTRPPQVSVTLDLGEDFAVQGHGLTARLTGRLLARHTGTSGSPMTLTGEVSVAQGRYRAWGQQLDIESGRAVFNGPPDNPALDVLALRPNIPVRAGVQITGSAQAPRVRLYADPDLPDAEKLAWVTLGRSAAAGGAQAAMLQQAALALLGSRAAGGAAGTGDIAGRLGLDEIGVRGPADGQDVTTAAVTVGKRLGDDLYVTYERSLSSALGTLYIFLDLSRRLTLRAQTGPQSALDLIYTMRYD